MPQKPLFGVGNFFGDKISVGQRIDDVKRRSTHSLRRARWSLRLVDQSESYKMPRQRASAGEALQAPTNGLEGVAEGGAAEALAAQLRASEVSGRRLHLKTKKT